MLAFSSGYRQVALTTNKHRIVHALKHELPVCLFSHVRILAVLDEKRTRAKSSDFLYVLFQSVGTKRTRGLKIRRRVPHSENTDLPQQRWLAAKGNAFILGCLFRKWQIACNQDRAWEEYCRRIIFNLVRPCILSVFSCVQANECMFACAAFMLFYSPLLGFDLTERSRSLVNANPIFTILNLYSF